MGVVTVRNDTKYKFLFTFCYIKANRFFLYCVEFALSKYQFVHNSYVPVCSRAVVDKSSITEHIRMD